MTPAELRGDTKRWHTARALSRSQKEQYRRVLHDSIDLNGSAIELAQQRERVGAGYVVFVAYLQKSFD